MKVGSLIQFRSRTAGVVFGVVVKDMGFYEEYQEHTVQVHWLDDNACTTEKVNNLLDPDEKNRYEVICESR